MFQQGGHSVAGVVVDVGNVVARYDYDAYGRRTLVAGTDLADFGYTGHYVHKPSGLHLALYRAYDADLGRWLNRDPIGEAGGINLYGYVGNDPVNKIDPFGLEQWPIEVCKAIVQYMASLAAKMVSNDKLGIIDLETSVRFFQQLALYNAHCKGDDDGGGDDGPDSPPRVPVPVKGLDRCPQPIPAVNRSWSDWTYGLPARRYRTPFSHAAPGLAVAAGAGLVTAAAAGSILARRPVIP